jgi:hypothetical protein
MDKCSAIMMDGCMGLCFGGNTLECNTCATRNAMNRIDELMKNGCTNRNRRLFRTADEAPQMCCQFQSPICDACRLSHKRNWYKRRLEIINLERSMNQDPDWSGEANVGGGRVYGEYNNGPYTAGAEYNWDEEEEN